jgi:hypothetical protein
MLKQQCSEIMSLILVDFSLKISFGCKIEEFLMTKFNSPANVSSNMIKLHLKQIQNNTKKLN